MNPSTIPLEQHLAETQRLQKEIAYLSEQLEWFKRQIFGQKSERIVQIPDDQLTLFELPPALPPTKNQSVEGFKRANRSAKSEIAFPADLPIERIICDVKESEKICKETGKPLIKIGEEISQKLAFKPGSYFIKEIVRPKYAMPKGSEEGILTASLPDSLITRCKADESFLADMLVKKFSDHLPLYRQSEILARENIFISRQVLSQWTLKCGLALKPLYDELIKEVLGTQNVFIDEVPVDMLKPGNGQVHKAYMWVMVGGKAANPPLRVYNFRTDRSYKNAAELLGNFHNGIVHSDKYGAYETLANKKQFIWCPCWAHIRRKFIEAEGGDSNFVKFILRKIRYLFMYERVAWNRSDEDRIRIRIEKEAPIIDELISLIKDKLIHGKTLPKSKFKEALGYFLGLIPYLKNYTLHPFARIDNNVAERAVRPLALGRKNWLFLGNEEGGEAAAIILSLVQSCKALNINPREYLNDIMRRLMSHNSQKIDQLLPHKWSKQT